MQIGFIGAGLMGHGMAANLLKAGHEVKVVAHRIAEGYGELRLSRLLDPKLNQD